MDDREQLLDELARVFARAAVDAFLLQQEADTKPPASTANRAGGGVNVEQEQDRRAKHRTAARAAASP